MERGFRLNPNNELKQNLEAAYRAQKITLYFILILLYSAFIGLQLGRIQAISDFNYTLHELLYIPINIAIFVIPVLLLIYLFLVMKYLRKRGKQKIKPNTLVKSILVILSVVIIFVITIHQFHEVSTSGIFEVQDKVYEDGKYYLVINDRKIRVTHNEYQLVLDHERYFATFIWNKRTPNKGKLETIQQLE